tara:strand:+ start:3592 stop:3837 length:246 start_codon:yes stop_codon:yes gene_type:complete
MRERVFWMVSIVVLGILVGQGYISNETAESAIDVLECECAVGAPAIIEENIDEATEEEAIEESSEVDLDNSGSDSPEEEEE